MKVLAIVFLLLVANALTGCLIVIPLAAMGLAKAAHVEYCDSSANRCEE